MGREAGKGKLRSFFLGRFERGSIVIRKKSTSLFYSLVVLFVISLASTILFAVTATSTDDIIIIGITSVAMAGLLFLLRAGRFELTVNLILVIGFTALSATVFLGTSMTQFKIYNLLSMQFVIFILAALVANRSYQGWGLGVVALLSNLYLYVFRIIPYMREQGSEGLPGVDAIMAAVVLITLSTIVLVSVIRNFNDLYVTVAEESEQIRESSQQLKRAVLEMQEGMRIGDHLIETAEATSGAVDVIDGNLREIQAVIADLSDDSDRTLEENRTLQEASATVKRVSDSHSSAVEETSSALEEMDSSLQSVGRISEEKNTKAQELSRSARSGMKELSDAVKMIAELNASSREILAIVDIISDISDQTNILSMNAAIQAARAGEHGKGFSVVASEIRSLAENSAQNAKRISDTIAGNLQVIQDAVARTESTQNIFREVHDEIGAMADAMNEMNSAVQEILVGTKEIITSTMVLREGSIETRDAVAHSEQAISRVAENLAAFSQKVQRILDEVGTITSNASTIQHEVRRISEIGEMNRDQIGRMTDLLSAEEFSHGG